MPLFTEEHKIVMGICPSTALITEATTEAETDLVNLGKYGHCCWVISLGTMTGGSGFTMKMYESATSTGAGTARGFYYRKVAGVFGTTACDDMGTLTYSTSLTITSTEDNKYYVVEVDNKELTDGYEFCSLGLAPTTGVSAIDGEILAIVGEPRYGGDIPASAIS